jgi:hypothetical protein
MRIRAARDAGDAKGDKARRASLKEIMDLSLALEGMAVPSGYPEVTEALAAAKGLNEVVTRMDMATARLKSAPGGSTEALEAQLLLDNLRASVDTLLPPLSVTLSTMSTLLEAAMEMERQFSALSVQTKVIEEKLKRDKQRLAAAAQAVRNAVQLA